MLTLEWVSGIAARGATVLCSKMSLTHATMIKTEDHREGSLVFVTVKMQPLFDFIADAGAISVDDIRRNLAEARLNFALVARGNEI